LRNSFIEEQHDVDVSIQETTINKPNQALVHQYAQQKIKHHWEIEKQRIEESSPGNELIRKG